MNNSNMFGTGEQMLEQIFKYVNNTEGLNFADCELSDYFIIEQTVDKRQIKINKFDVEDVLNRVDEDGQEFLQVNFVSGKKGFVNEKACWFPPINDVWVGYG